MAKAARSLSPKQIRERMQQHRTAVAVLARQSARRVIKAQIKAAGLKVSQFTARDISIRADVWFDAHRVELIAEAVWAQTFPYSTSTARSIGEKGNGRSVG